MSVEAERDIYRAALERISDWDFDVPGYEHAIRAFARRIIAPKDDATLAAMRPRPTASAPEQS